MPALTQQVNASKRGGGILGIEQQTPGSSVKPPSQLHHPQGKVHIVSALGKLDELLAAFQKSCAVVFFTSATCPPCKTLYPLYDELAAEFGEKAALIKVDVSQAFDVARRYSITATPTFITFLKGKQENRWSGADPSALRGNIRLLVQMAWPPHPHQALDLPTFTNLDAEYVIFTKIPPLEKLLAKMGPTASEPVIQSVRTFIEKRASDGPAEATLPDLAAFGSLVRSCLTSLPDDSLFAVVDLLRCVLADPRVSGYFAEEQPAHHTITSVLEHVAAATVPPRTCPYALRLVALQLACNLFSSPLYPAQALATHAPLRAAVTQLLSSSFLDDAHANTRVAAAGLLYDVALANGRRRRDGPGDLLPEDEQVELAASVLEAIAQEEGSRDALEGMLRGLGWLAYRLPLDGEVADLLRAMDAGGTVLKKGEKGQIGEGLALVREVGEVLLGKGLERKT